MLRLFQRQPPEQAAHIEIAHGGEVYRVALKRVATSRRFTLRVRTATRDALLTMPSRSSLKSAREFAKRHAAWIGTRLARLPEPVAFAPRAVTPLRGVDHRIVHRPGERGVVWLEAGERGPLICVSGERPHMARRVTDFLKREAKRELETASRRAADKLGVKIKRVSIRDQASRWGSCSTTGVLSYSWRLILAPPFVLDYLAAHEVAHLVEMNHSRAFWRLVMRICPNVARAKIWLDSHGSELHRYGLREAGAA